jgi:mono/diheme cytochrome c family protein
MKPCWLLAPLALVSALCVACGSGRRSEPLIGPLRPASTEQLRGELVFFRQCHKCHPGGDAGLGPAINNKPLPEAAIKLQVRTGVGAMPAFDDQRISDEDLDALVGYLEVLRKAQ